MSEGLDVRPGQLWCIRKRLKYDIDSVAPIDGDFVVIVVSVDEPDRSNVTCRVVIDGWGPKSPYVIGDVVPEDFSDEYQDRIPPVERWELIQDA